jgi:hypothetical protein
MKSFAKFIFLLFFIVNINASNNNSLKLTDSEKECLKKHPVHRFLEAGKFI